MSCCKHLISSIRNCQHDPHRQEVYARTQAKHPGHGDDETDALALLWQWVESSDPDDFDDERELLTNDYVTRDILFDERDEELYATEEAASSYSDF